ncbi:unnamed protein product [Schistocephalus solidus]|uniref:Reverse transcriptase domain-containing protein n=1 Tax=Schistocephalus solidus TaxID=70667 RepID=A0A183SGC6_SCHSO|nr:unnamed protein product [Schistocephalus solidus]
MVNRDRLWKVMQKFGCPERFAQMVRQLYDHIMAPVTDNRARSEAFSVTSGVKQGSVSAPIHFSLMFFAMLMDAYRDKSPGIRIANRTDGQLLNSWRTQAPTRVSTTTVHDLIFADDCALNNVTGEDMQRSMNLFVAVCVNFGLTINTDKLVVMYEPPPSAKCNAPRICVNGAQIKNGETKANQAFGQLQSSM